MPSEFHDADAGLQRPLQPEAPFEQRQNAGWFRKGEPGPALTHGGRSRLVAAGLLPEQAEAAAAVRERVAAVLADLGGSEAVSELGRGLVERHARLEMVADYLFENLERHGPLTPKGAGRAALGAWLGVVDRLQRSALALGLERRQKPMNPLDRVRDAVIEANK